MRRIDEVSLASGAVAAVVVDGCTKANKEKRWNVKRKPKKSRERKKRLNEAIRIHGNRRRCWIRRLSIHDE